MIKKDSGTDEMREITLEDSDGPELQDLDEMFRIRVHREAESPEEEAAARKRIPRERTSRERTSRKRISGKKNFQKSRKKQKRRPGRESSRRNRKEETLGKNFGKSRRRRESRRRISGEQSGSLEKAAAAPPHFPRKEGLHISASAASQPGKA